MGTGAVEQTKLNLHNILLGDWVDKVVPFLWMYPSDINHYMYTHVSGNEVTTHLCGFKYVPERPGYEILTSKKNAKTGRDKQCVPDPGWFVREERHRTTWSSPLESSCSRVRAAARTHPRRVEIRATQGQNNANETQAGVFRQTVTTFLVAFRRKTNLLVQTRRFHIVRFGSESYTSG